MAKLPNPDSLERPSPRPELSVVPLRPSSGAEGAPGKALAQVGAQLQQTGDELYRVVKVEEQKQNKIRAEDAFNQLRQQQLDLTIGEQAGFVHRKGEAAVKKPLFSEYTGLLDEQAKRIEGGLANDEQRELFRERAGISRLQFQEGLLRHITQENDQYAKYVFSGTMDTEVRNVTAQWQDPAARAISLERMNAAIDTEAARSGWSPEFTQATKLKEESRVHAAVIGQALATNNYQFANKYFEANRPAIDLTTAKAVEKAVEDGTQKQLSNIYRSEFLQVQGNYRGLSALRDKIMGDQTLDDGRRNALVGPIQNQMMTIERRNEAAADRQTRAVERTLGRINSMTLSGYEPSQEQLLQIVNATKGTAMEAEALNVVATAQATRQFRLSPFPQQETMINTLEQQVRAAPTPERVDLLSKYKTIAERQRQQVQTSPVTFAYQQGLADPVQVNLAKPAESSPQLIQQIGVARGMVDRYGADFKPLMPDQLNQVKAALKTGSPEQQVQYFGQLRGATGADAPAYSAIMRQLAPDAPAIAIAGDFAGRGRESVATDILRGIQYMNPNRKEDGQPAAGKLWPMPKGADEKVMETMFSDYTRGALLDPNHRSAVEQAARALYTARSVTVADDTGVLNTDRWRQAMKDVTGGVESYNGKKTVMPYGMNRGDFRSGVTMRINDVAVAGNLAPGVTADQVRDMPVDAIGDGRYVLRSGDGVLVDKNRRPVILNFNVDPAPLAISAPPTDAEVAAASVPATGRSAPKRDKK